MLIIDSRINGSLIDVDTVEKQFIFENSKLNDVFLELDVMGETPNQYKNLLINLMPPR